MYLNKRILLSERKQSEKATYCVYSGKGKTMERVKRSVVAKGSGEGGTDEQEEHSEFLRQWNYSV